MEDDALKPANGGDAEEILTAVDDPVVPNGLQHEKGRTLTPTQAQEGDEDGGGSGGTIKLLRQEIQGLRRDRSELQRNLEEKLAEMERSEAAKEAIASQASNLEGELFRTQEDLAAVSSVAEDAEADARALRQAVQDLEAEKASLVPSITALESQIRGLEERAAAYEAMEADLVAEREAMAATGSKREREISLLELKGRALEEQLRFLREGKEAIEEEAKRGASREEELERSVRELEEGNAELEGKIDGLVSKIDRDLAVDQKKEEFEVVAENGLKVPWVATAAAMASTATVSAAITAIFLRQSRQR